MCLGLLQTVFKAADRVRCDMSCRRGEEAKGLALLGKDALGRRGMVGGDEEILINMTIYMI